jgi:phosphopantothenoylcysteine decarboxylase/phosphopantothenate--cysteine ligase
LIPPRGVEFLKIETAEEMRIAVLKFLPEATVLIMAAAVADWRPVSPLYQKAKKTEPSWRVELIQSPDILQEVKKSRRRDQIIVGFSAETEKVHENANKKLKDKGLDLIVANDVTQPGAGFGTDTNIVSMIDGRGGIEELPKMPKEQVAGKILDRILEVKKKRDIGRAHSS